MNSDISIPKARAQDPDTYHQIYSTYRPLLLRYCTQILRDADLAEDVVQDTLLRAWRSLPSTSEDLKLSGWLHTIAHNRCVDLIREKARRPTLSLDEAANIPDLPPLDLGVEYLGILSPQDVTLLKLRYQGNLGYSDIARAANLPEARARKLLKRAEDKIRRAGAPDGR